MLLVFVPFSLPNCPLFNHFLDIFHVFKLIKFFFDRLFDNIGPLLKHVSVLFDMGHRTGCEAVVLGLAPSQLD